MEIVKKIIKKSQKYLSAVKMLSVNSFQIPSDSTSLSFRRLVERILEFIISESPNCILLSFKFISLAIDYQLKFNTSKLLVALKVLLLAPFFLQDCHHCNHT